MKALTQKAMLAAACCAVIAWPEKAAGDNANDNIPPPAVLTPEQQKAFEFKRKLFEHPALNRIWAYELFSLSLFSKHCDWVALGTVERAECFDKRTEGGPFSCNIFFLVDACIHGRKLPVEKLTLRYVWIRGESESEYDLPDRRVPAPGDKMLVFLRDSGNGGIDLCSSARAHVFLDDKETEEAVINAVKGYIAMSGEGEKNDKGKYYEFLCSLMQSPVKRIRDDAERDLLFLYTKETSLDLDKPLNDARVRKEVKDYLRYLLRNEKPEGL
jgi:hypothetical protein